MISKYFGSNLKHLREQKNLEQKDLSEIIGYRASSVISEWESGRRMPNIGIIHDLSRYFNVSIDDLVNKDLTIKNETWYINPESARVAQELLNNPDLKMLFDAARDISPEDLKLMAEMALRMKRAERHHPEDYPDEVYPDDFNQSPPKDD